MAKRTNEERQALVSLIDSGQFQKPEELDDKEANVAVIVLFAIFLIFLVLTLTMFDYKNSSVKEYLGLGAFVIFMVTIGIYGFILSRRSKGPKLGELTEEQRWLILNGEEIEAHLDTVEETGRYYVLSCSAEYKGEQRQFTSSTVKVRPLPIKERKVAVYIDPNDPLKYIVDVYSHLPEKGKNKLIDRSELKRQPRMTDKQKVELVIMIVVGVIGVLLAGMVIKYSLSLFSQGKKEKEMGMMLLIFLVPMIVFALVYGIVKRFKDMRTVWGDGYYLYARGVRFWAKEIYDDGSRKEFHLLTRYTEPKNKRAHEFEVVGPAKMQNLVDAKVKVYVNPENLNEYFVDINGTLEELGFVAKEDYGEKK